MNNTINSSLANNDTLNNIISNENFSQLNPQLQNTIITAVNDNKAKDGGFLGKLLGLKPINIAMNIALLICVLLILIVIIDTLHAYHIDKSINIELINIVLPVVTLSLGYIFGKGSNN